MFIARKVLHDGANDFVPGLSSEHLTTRGRVNDRRCSMQQGATGSGSMQAGSYVVSGTRKAATRHAAGRQRDPSLELRERRRFELLREIHRRTGDQCAEPIAGLDAGGTIGLSREETFRSVQFLAHHGYLRYLGAGPRVAMTWTGIRYLRGGAGRRRSVRSPGS
jgi:hypothetical protein